jgi:hypothetical protein
MVGQNKVVRNLPMSAESQPILSFTCNFDEQTEFEVEKKGFFEHAVACLPDGKRVKVCFVDPIRLARDLESEQELGHISIGEPGLIVIPTVTVENMIRAINELYQNGFFDDLSSLIH